MPGRYCGAGSRRQWSVSGSLETQLAYHPGPLFQAHPRGTSGATGGDGRTPTLSSVRQLQCWGALGQLLCFPLLH